MRFYIPGQIIAGLVGYPASPEQTCIGNLVKRFI